MPKTTAESTGTRKRTSPSRSAGRSRKVVDQPMMQLSEAERRHYIAEAAYYIAERRDFESGSPEADWLAAEAEIDHMLTSARH